MQVEIMLPSTAVVRVHLDALPHVGDGIEHPRLPALDGLQGWRVSERSISYAEDGSVALAWLAITPTPEED